MIETEEADTCPLCDRPLPESSRSWHHLIPKSRKGKETVIIHVLCHNMIHALIRNKDLARTYNTIDALKTHPDILNFIEWVANKDPDFYVRPRAIKRQKAA